MFDLVKLTIKAGDGGNGKVSFRREKFIPKGGPDGGNAGNGGSVYLRGVKHVNTLQHFAGVKEYKAQPGENGGKQKQIGHKGEDIELQVPIGTTIWLLADNRASRRRRLFVPREGARKPQLALEKYYLDKPSGNAPAREPDDLRVVSIREETDSAFMEPQMDEEVVNDEMEMGQQSEDDEGIDEQDDSAELSEEDGAEMAEEQEVSAEDVILRSSSLKNINLRVLPKIKIGEITEDDQTFLLCQGGIGGRGNINFKSSTNTTPFEAEYGSFGEQKIILLELKLLADIALVGYPNAGKSTFLSLVTKANPKIANYPFTTLEPNLGVMSMGDKFDRDIVIADIPGIIEGASQGKGLGFEFLRHIQACRLMLYILSLDESEIFSEETSLKQKAEQLYQQFTVLRSELGEFDKSLLDRKYLISISKEDLYSPELVAEIKAVFAKHKLDGQKLSPIFMSAITKKGIPQLQDQIVHELGE